jgi:hypothetical protein
LATDAANLYWRGQAWNRRLPVSRLVAPENSLFARQGIRGGASPTTRKFLDFAVNGQ